MWLSICVDENSGGEEQCFHSHQQLDHAIREREHFCFVLGSQLTVGNMAILSFNIGISNVI